jgi:hypothetical protein
MQTLFYGLIGRKDSEEVTQVQEQEQQKQEQPEESKEDFETLGCPQDQTINQIHRKIKLLNEFKHYIQDADENTIYYNYIINTTIYEQNGKNKNIYTILPGFFGKLHEYITSDNSDDFLRILISEL